MRIAIDPGHGGSDPGAVAGGVSEAAVVLDYGHALSATVLARGLSPYLIRTADEAMALSTRAKAANDWSADAFVSLHINASASERARGLQAFHARGSARGEELARMIFAAVYPDGRPAGTSALVTPDQSVHSGYTTAAQLFANRLPGVLTWAERDAAVRAEFGQVAAYRSLAVLRQTAMPAVLLELGFVTNPEERAWLQRPDTMEELCGRIADGIQGWAGIETAPAWPQLLPLTVDLARTIEHDPLPVGQPTPPDRVVSLLERPAVEAATELVGSRGTLRDLYCAGLDPLLAAAAEKLPWYISASLARQVIARLLGCDGRSS